MNAQAQQLIDNLAKGSIPVDETPYKLLEKISEISSAGCPHIMFQRSGVFPMITKSWLTEMKERWIGNGVVLEVMSGLGHLALGLAQVGVTIKATDNGSWFPDKTKVFPVENIDAVDAVYKYKDAADVLLMSWPPGRNSISYEVIKAWGPDKPIIYIGEDDPDITASYKFFSHFSEKESITYQPQWFGLHDYARLGYYVEECMISSKADEDYYDPWFCDDDED